MQDNKSYSFSEKHKDLNIFDFRYSLDRKLNETLRRIYPPFTEKLFKGTLVVAFLFQFYGKCEDNRKMFKSFFKNESCYRSKSNSKKVEMKIDSLPKFISNFIQLKLNMLFDESDFYSALTMMHIDKKFCGDTIAYSNFLVLMSIHGSAYYTNFYTTAHLALHSEEVCGKRIMRYLKKFKFGSIKKFLNVLLCVSSTTVFPKYSRDCAFQYPSYKKLGKLVRREPSRNSHSDDKNAHLSSSSVEQFCLRSKSVGSAKKQKQIVKTKCTEISYPSINRRRRCQPTKKNIACNEKIKMEQPINKSAIDSIKTNPSNLGCDSRKSIESATIMADALNKYQTETIPEKVNAPHVYVFQTGDSNLAFNNDFLSSFTQEVVVDKSELSFIHSFRSIATTSGPDSSILCQSNGDAMYCPSRSYSPELSMSCASISNPVSFDNPNLVPTNKLSLADDASDICSRGDQLLLQATIHEYYSEEVCGYINKKTTSKAYIEKYTPQMNDYESLADDTVLVSSQVSLALESNEKVKTKFVVFAK